MKQKFKPESLPSGYTGHVVIRMPTYGERLSFFSEDLIDETDGTPGEEPQTDAEKASQKRRMAKRSSLLMQTVASRMADFIVEVDIVREKDNFKFQTFEHLNYDSDMVPVLTEIAGRIIGKYEVGSPS
jgi:hypothetical protein